MAPLCLVFILSVTDVSVTKGDVHFCYYCFKVLLINYKGVCVRESGQQGAEEGVQFLRTGILDS